MVLTAAITSQVLKGSIPNGPILRFGTTGKITTVKNRNFVRVKISCAGIRRVLAVVD